jgi:hypothetical protein
VPLRRKYEPRGEAELSSYEDYTRKFGNYDKTRKPVGTEILVGCFAHAPVPLDRTVMLDAGCGTGSYSDALLGYVGRIEAVDTRGDRAPRTGGRRLRDPGAAPSDRRDQAAGP